MIMTGVNGGASFVIIMNNNYLESGFYLFQHLLLQQPFILQQRLVTPSYLLIQVYTRSV